LTSFERLSQYSRLSYKAENNSNEIDKTRGWQDEADGIAGNSVAVISCVTNQIIIIHNSRPIETPTRNDNMPSTLRARHSSSIINVICVYS